MVVSICYRFQKALYDKPLCFYDLYEGVYFVWGQDVARIKKGPPIEKNEKPKENVLYFLNVDRGPLFDTRNGHDLCWLLRDVLKSYREEIHEFVKYSSAI